MVEDNNILSSKNLDSNNPPKIDKYKKYMTDEEIIDETEKIKNNIDGFFEINKNMFKGINYDLTKLKINCGKEEIQGLIYYEKYSRYDE